MIWTSLYGLFGGAMLLASIARGCHRCVGYGGAMMVSWLVTALAIGIAEDRLGAVEGARWALVAIIPADASIGLLVALALTRRYEIKGVIILELILWEMIAHLAAWALGMWGGWWQYFAMNVIWCACVIVAGGANVQAIFRDWRAGRFDRARPATPGPAVADRGAAWTTRR